MGAGSSGEGPPATMTTRLAASPLAGHRQEEATVGFGSGSNRGFGVASRRNAERRSQVQPTPGRKSRCHGERPRRCTRGRVVRWSGTLPPGPPATTPRSSRFRRTFLGWLICGSPRSPWSSRAEIGTGARSSSTLGGPCPLEQSPNEQKLGVGGVRTGPATNPMQLNRAQDAWHRPLSSAESRVQAACAERQNQGASW